VRVRVNGAIAAERKLDRMGVFVLEADLDAPVEAGAECRVTIEASPVWSVPEDDRSFSVNISMIRLIDAGA
jgi:hypothetical protein